MADKTVAEAGYQMSDPCATNLLAYSEWLDAQGLVVGDQTPGADTRPHADLVRDFLAESS